MKPYALVISCEHAVNTVPRAYLHLFKSHLDVLKTHQAIDFGAAALAEHLAHITNCDYVAAAATRLLIDCNRSLMHHHCFCAWTNALDSAEKASLIATYYQPFRQRVIQCIKQHVAAGQRVLHLSIHSFTPVLHGITRQTDIGFLYDPTRVAEKEFARGWKAVLSKQAPAYRVRMNYPYRGTSDGFTRSLRKNDSSGDDYIGIEVEINQALMQSDVRQHALIEAITQSLLALLSVKQSESSCL